MNACFWPEQVWTVWQCEKNSAVMTRFLFEAISHKDALIMSLLRMVAGMNVLCVCVCVCVYPIRVRWSQTDDSEGAGEGTMSKYVTRILVCNAGGFDSVRHISQVSMCR